MELTKMDFSSPGRMPLYRLTQVSVGPGLCFGQSTVSRCGLPHFQWKLSEPHFFLSLRCGSSHWWLLYYPGSLDEAGDVGDIGTSSQPTMDMQCEEEINL